MVGWHSASFYPYDLQCDFWRRGVDDKKHHDGGLIFCSKRLISSVGGLRWLAGADDQVVYLGRVRNSPAFRTLAALIHVVDGWIYSCFSLYVARLQKSRRCRSAETYLFIQK